MLPIILYAVLAILVAFIGAGKRGGFLLYLVISLVMTPISGIITVLIAPEAKSNSKGENGR